MAHPSTLVSGTTSIAGASPAPGCLLRPVYTTNRFIPISGGAGFKPFSHIHTGIIMNRFHVTRMRANSLIYHVSLPNNRVIYSGLQLADNGANSCVFLSSLFSPQLCHCTTEEGESGYEEDVVLA